MKLDLIYVEGLYPAVRHLEATDQSADERVRQILDTGSKVSRQPISVDVDDVYSHLEMEAALCVWEYLCDITVNTKNPDEKWMRYRDAVGSVELRHDSIKIGKWALQVYDLLPEWVVEGRSYDWEIIPDIVSELTPGEPYPDVNGAAANVKTLSPDARRNYLFWANEFLRRDYAISFTGAAGLTEEDFFKYWFDPAVDPEDIADRYAEKYGLEKVK